MRTIIPFKENWAFDPETNHLMGHALDIAWESLTARGDRLSSPIMAARSRERLAKRIVELFQRGELDPIRLSDGAVAHLTEQKSDGWRGEVR